MHTGSGGLAACGYSLLMKQWLFLPPHHMRERGYMTTSHHLFTRTALLLLGFAEVWGGGAMEMVWGPAERISQSGQRGVSAMKPDEA